MQVEIQRARSISVCTILEILSVFNCTLLLMCWSVIWILPFTPSVSPLSRVRPYIPRFFIFVFYKNLCISDLSRINLKTFKLSSCSTSRMYDRKILRGYHEYNNLCLKWCGTSLHPIASVVYYLDRERESHANQSRFRHDHHQIVGIEQRMFREWSSFLLHWIVYYFMPAARGKIAKHRIRLPALWDRDCT